MQSSPYELHNRILPVPFSLSADLFHHFLLPGSYQELVVYGKKHLTYPQDSGAFHW